MAYKTLTCECCGDEYEGYHTSKYCDDCPKATCANCEEGFEVDHVRPSRDKRFCSEECLATYRSNKATLTCEQCGESFKAKPSDEAKFCSAECHAESMVRDLQERECAHCGQTMKLKPWSDKKYCSNECQSAGRRDQVTLTCEHCGDEFTLKRAKAERSDKHYCSHECVGKDREREVRDGKLQCADCEEWLPFDMFSDNGSDKSRGKMSYCRSCMMQRKEKREQWEAKGEVNGQQLYEIRRAQDNDCTYCGRNLNDLEVHVDHITPRAKGGEHRPGNVHWTCAPCNLQKSDKTHEQFATHLGREADLSWHPYIDQADDRIRS
jgi:5-methylcytosine-specific restriction endonuclease McrA